MTHIEYCNVLGDIALAAEAITLIGKEPLRQLYTEHTCAS